LPKCRAEHRLAPGPPCRDQPGRGQAATGCHQAHPAGNAPASTNGQDNLSLVSGRRRQEGRQGQGRRCQGLERQAGDDPGTARHHPS
jgi:hypothetical protein